MLITIGGELEGTAFTASGESADVLAELGGGIVTGVPFEMVTGDMAASSIELVTGVCTNGKGILHSFRKLEKLVPVHLSLEFVPTCGPKVKITKKSRAKAVMLALENEQKGGARGVPTVAAWSSFQTQLGIGDRMMTDEGVFFLDYLNNIAPYARLKSIAVYKVLGDDEHFMCWQGWCKRERVPGPRHFYRPESLNRFVGSIPKLVTKKDGSWVPARGVPSRLGDPESEGTLWWAARPRCFDGIWTVEWRMFPSLKPDDAAALSEDVCKLADSFWRLIEDNPSADWTQKRWRARMYEALSMRSYLAPPFVLSDDEWWKLYRL